ncbi:hypothetical protein LOAG_03382 [Loa loa]|uniref:Product n=1 Tax=Loa loa TaxID=7209 RepID=A0A1I7VAZ3_LOALO|nr:hypothetical protein LOAG_03382 [Loa loa]EFO25105.1 hypothetical protein LOAG_03382 [Loa loa]
MSDLLSSGDDSKLMDDDKTIHFTKLKLLNESCIIDGDDNNSNDDDDDDDVDNTSIYTLRTYHDNSSSCDEAMMIESNESFPNTSISSIISEKLKLSVENQTSNSCSDKGINFMNSIHGTASTQSSQTESDDLKSQIIDDEMSQLSQLCYTARTKLPEEITNPEFINLYQISDDQQTPEYSDQTAKINAQSESIITETNDIIQEGVELEQHTETVQNFIRNPENVS